MSVCLLMRDGNRVSPDGMIIRRNWGEQREREGYHNQSILCIKNLFLIKEKTLPVPRKELGKQQLSCPVCAGELREKRILRDPSLLQNQVYTE